jgi:hypothetical protein
VRQDGDATVRVRMGEGSPVHLGTPALILDVELPTGGQVTTSVPTGFQGFAYVLDGEAAFGANWRRARPAHLVLLGPGAGFAAIKQRGRWLCAPTWPRGAPEDAPARGDRHRARLRDRQGPQLHVLADARRPPSVWSTAPGRWWRSWTGCGGPRGR